MLICCIFAELCYQEPAGGEVVGSAALTGAGPGEVPQLQHETAQQAEAGAGEVGESEAQQQTGELSVPKPETQNDPFFSCCGAVLPGPSEENYRGGSEVC